MSRTNLFGDELYWRELAAAEEKRADRNAEKIGRLQEELLMCQGLIEELRSHIRAGRKVA